jgi:hypothetical protein
VLLLFVATVGDKLALKTLPFFLPLQVLVYSIESPLGPAFGES